MNSLTISNTNAKDIKSRSLVAKFFVGENFAKGIPGRRVPEICEAYGDNASHFTCDVPVRELIKAGTWDQREPVALNTNGPAGKIKLFARASGGILDNGKYVPLVNGWVVDIGHHLRADSVSFKIFDDRHIMTRYLCFGRMVYEPNASGTGGATTFYNTNENDPLCFNRDGHGDMISGGSRPRFAVGRRYGGVVTPTDDGGTYPDAGGGDTSKARLWRCSDIIEYLRDFFTSGIQLGQDYGLMQLPKSIKWPRNLGAILEYDRTPYHLELQGLDLLSALRRVVQLAGPYDIHLQPISDTESELKIINFNPSDKTGSFMYTAKYLNAPLEECANNPSIIWDGVITETARKTYPGGVAFIGNAPSTERMVSTDTSSDDGLGGLGYAENGWTSTVQTAALAHLQTLKAGTGAGVATEENWNKMRELYPNVFCWYKLNNQQNPFEGTKWSSLAKGGSMRFKPNQLTPYNETAGAPIGMVSREVIVEHKVSASEYSGMTADDQARGWWRLAGKYPGFQISPCGRYIAIPGLADGDSPEGRAGTVSHDGGTRYDPDYIQPRKMRFQVAVEHNQAMVVRAGKASQDRTGTMHRIDAGAPKWTLQMVNPPNSFVCFTRRLSYPSGIGGLKSTDRTSRLALFPERASANQEIYTDNVGDGELTNPKNRMALQAEVHAKNYKRVDYQGVVEFAQLTAAWRVGMQITIEAEASVAKVSGIIRAVCWSSTSQHTQVEFGPNDLAALYDGPISLSSNMGGAGGASTGSSDSDNGYKDEGGVHQSGGDSPSGGSSSSSNDVGAYGNRGSAGAAGMGAGADEVRPFNPGGTWSPSLNKHIKLPNQNNPGGDWSPSKQRNILQKRATNTGGRFSPSLGREMTWKELRESRGGFRKTLEQPAAAAGRKAKAPEKAPFAMGLKGALTGFNASTEKKERDLEAEEMDSLQK